MNKSLKEIIKQAGPAGELIEKLITNKITRRLGRSAIGAGIGYGLGDIQMRGYSKLYGKDPSLGNGKNYDYSSQPHDLKQIVDNASQAAGHPGLTKWAPESMYNPRAQMAFLGALVAQPEVFRNIMYKPDTIVRDFDSGAVQIGKPKLNLFKRLIANEELPKVIRERVIKGEPRMIRGGITLAGASTALPLIASVTDKTKRFANELTTDIGKTPPDMSYPEYLGRRITKPAIDRVTGLVDDKYKEFMKTEYPEFKQEIYKNLAGTGLGALLSMAAYYGVKTPAMAAIKPFKANANDKRSREEQADEWYESKKRKELYATLAAAGVSIPASILGYQLGRKYYPQITKHSSATMTLPFITGKQAAYDTNSIVSTIASREKLNPYPKNIGDGKLTVGYGETDSNAVAKVLGRSSMKDIYAGKREMTPQEASTLLTARVPGYASTAFGLMPEMTNATGRAQAGLVSSTYQGVLSSSPKARAMMRKALQTKNPKLWQRAGVQFMDYKQRFDPKLGAGITRRMQNDWNDMSSVTNGWGNAQTQNNTNRVSRTGF